jgi:hypothetical protein
MVDPFLSFSPVALNPSAKILFYICFFAARCTFPH